MHCYLGEVFPECIWRYLTLAHDCALKVRVDVLITAKAITSWLPAHQGEALADPCRAQAGESGPYKTHTKQARARASSGDCPLTLPR